MIEKLQELKKTSEQTLKNIQTQKILEDFRVSLFGRKGSVTILMKELSNLSKDERPKVGQLLNEIRREIEHLFTEKQKDLKQKEMHATLQSESIDVTMPGTSFDIGKKHPLTSVMDEIKSIFLGMGYKIVDGPDIETPYYNFDALNIPKTHPARDMQDTFYIGQHLLRTQTSPVQVRTMETREMPIKVIAPGRVYRPDEVDATHSPIFHQIEGLVIDRNITMANLKGTLFTFAKQLFGKDVKIRLRPHHFPFTEPSAELDISCTFCNISTISTCKVCRGEGFIELLGCGMVHPNVLQMSGINTNEYTGFAFGMGLERLAMQRFGIEDLRLFYENDVRFLNQF